MSDVNSAVQTPPARLADRIWYRWFAAASVLGRADYDDLLKAAYNTARCAGANQGTASDLCSVAFEGMAHEINAQPIVSSNRKAYLQDKLMRAVLDHADE